MFYFQDGRQELHFKPMYFHCSPCIVNYDYILELETFEEDLEYLFNIIEVKMKTNVTENTTHKKQYNHDFDKYFGNISSDLLFEFYQLVKDDLFIFNYTLPHVIYDKIKHKIDNSTF